MQSVRLAFVLVSLAGALETLQEPAASAPLVVRVAQDGSGDLRGTDDVPIQAALERLREAGGGRLELGPGRWLVRRTIQVPSGVTLRGAPGSLLQLPAPRRLRAPAAAGALRLDLDPADLGAGTHIDVLPPEGQATLPDGETPGLRVRIASVEEDGVALADPLGADVPAGARVGYPHKMLLVVAARDVVLEDLVIDGGRDPAIAMPGHHQRTAIWAVAHFSYTDGPVEPPTANVVVRACEIRNCYGRAVAFYNVVDSAVIGCRIRDLADEAIDFDHFAFRCRAVGNEIENALTGVTMNDASHCVVEFNHIRGCERGIDMWWLNTFQLEGLNVDNTIRHNFVRDSKTIGISLGARCHRNVVRHNFVEGGLEVAEPDNTVERNTVR